MVDVVEFALKICSKTKTIAGTMKGSKTQIHSLTTLFVCG